MERRIGEADTEAERQVESALAEVKIWHGKDIRYTPIHGGFSNSNWRVRIHGEDNTFFVKMPGQGTEMFIDRNAAAEAGRRAYRLGIGPRTYDYLRDRGIEVTDFLDGCRQCTTRDFHSRQVRAKTIDLYRAFNESGPLGLTKTVFDMIDEHVSQLRQLGGDFPADFAWLCRQYEQARQALEASGLDIVPCYNDPTPANFLMAPDGTITIVDFEYASNNDRCYDLAIWCGEMFFSDAVLDEVIEAYFGRVEKAIQARMFVYRMLADFKWSTWAMIQKQISSIDFDFYKFGAWKQMRMRATLQDPRWTSSLETL